MRIRPPEIETSICDEKYRVSLALSVIPRGSWGDVASFGNCVDRSDQIVDRSYDEVTLIGMNRMFIRWTGPAPGPMGRFKPVTPILSLEPRVAYHNSTPTNPRPKLAAAPSFKATRRLAPPCAAASCRDRTCSDQLDEEFPSVLNSLKRRFPRETGRSQAPRRQQEVESGSATANPNRSDRRPNRKNDRKVLVAEESNKNWSDTDSDSSSRRSSSNDSEQEEVHCLMANQTSEDEVFDFSNTEFTREDLITALNEMVHEYSKLSKTFEEVKAENVDLKNCTAEPSTVELGKTDSLQIELSKIKTENESLRIRSNELESEIEKLKLTMSSWTKSSVSLDKLFEI
ncbi:hypothetical protein F511_39668 [Dorcoceras hygrometricum]|uniref:Uncharacterized protein n=1 Tax=Dorcoceras hygrometricum TaxID=472368 RepID=A0A2Z7BZD1_9LAMI|nr:hypothetical protein F511_39668 [Dorcoceras hygrometricum]